MTLVISAKLFFPDIKNIPPIDTVNPKLCSALIKMIPWLIWFLGWFDSLADLIMISAWYQDDSLIDLMIFFIREFFFMKWLSKWNVELQVWKLQEKLTHLKEMKWSCEKLHENLHEKLQEKLSEKLHEKLQENIIDSAWH